MLKYLTKAFGVSRVRGFTKVELGDRVCEFFKIVATRTRIPKRFAAVINSSELWGQVENLLQAAVRGSPTAAPQAEADEDVPVADWAPR